MRMTKIVFALAAAVGCTACAGVEFYSDAGLTKGAGIPIYAPKPYLLVARTGNKDKPVEVSIVYLPDRDPKKMIYAKPKSGFGSSNLTMALANGQLTSFGQQTDTKVPELLNAVSGMITAQAGADKLNAETMNLLGGADKGGQGMMSAFGTNDFSKLAAVAGTVAVDMATYLAPGTEPSKGLFPSEAQKVKQIATDIGTAAAALGNAQNPSDAAPHVITLRAQADALGKFSKAGTAGTARDKALTAIEIWATQLRAALAEVIPASSKADFELWEIMPDGTLKLAM